MEFNLVTETYEVTGLRMEKAGAITDLVTKHAGKMNDFFPEKDNFFKTKITLPAGKLPEFQSDLRALYGG